MPKIVDRESKKRKILTAALKVFSRNGYYNTKISEIAREAKMGKGTLYEYFRSKEEIFAQSFLFLFAGLEEKLMQLMKSPLTPREKLEKVIELSLNEFIAHGEGFIEVVMDFWAEGIRNKHTEKYKEIDLKSLYTEYRNLVAAIIKEGMDSGEFKNVDPMMEASFVMALLDGLMLQWFMDKNVFDLTSVSANIIQHVMNALS